MLKTNILANVLGRGWSLVMGLVFIPLYIKFLGIEAYGLIGFHVTLQALFSVLDLGLGSTLNRELARDSMQPENAQRMRDLLRTLETIYWGIAVLIGITVMVLAPLIARYWLNEKGLSESTVEQAVMLFGGVIAFQWPTGFYSGGLMGLQRQVLNNLITSILATVRGAGAVLILWLISPTIEAYFQWQIIVSALGTALMALSLWQSLPKGHRPARFSVTVLHSVWRFAAGMTSISVVTLFLTQTDKILLSTLLPLEMFGYYTLASAVASAVPFFVGPIFGAVFPRFSQLVSLGDPEQLKQLYHRACQLLSVVILPPVLVVSLFSYEVMFLWTGDAVTAEHTHWIVSLLVIGTAFNGLMHPPYALQLAHGWTQLAFTANMIATVVLVPLTIVLATRYGAIGAAAVWVILNTGYVLFSIPTMHRRLLKGEQWRWYMIDVGRPLVAGLPVVILMRWLCPEDMTKVMTLIYLAGAAWITLIAAILATPLMRVWIIDHIAQWRIDTLWPLRTANRVLSWHSEENIK